jgi:glycine/D-amino acid oxidase-like deaminating enzyme
VGPAEGLERYARVIDCRGVEGAIGGAFEFVPWQFSKGEILEVDVEGLEFGQVLNDGHWVLPVRSGVAWVGATHEPGEADRQPTRAGREVLEASARRLLTRPFRVLDHRAGVRVNLPDKLPVVGVHPREARLGLVNGLGAKGVLLAPALARQWASHLTHGTNFDPAFDVGRFAPGT